MKRFLPHSSPRMFLLVPAALSLALGGCQLMNKEEKPAAEGEVKAVTEADIANWETSGTWKLIKNNPPTYYPVGVAANVETGFREGEWVVGEETQPRFFIPRKGSAGKSQDQLIAEAAAIIESMRVRKLIPDIPTPSLPEVKMPKVKLPSLPKLGGGKKEG